MSRKGGPANGPALFYLLAVKLLPKTILCLDAGFRNTGVAVWDCRLQKFVYTSVISFPKVKERYVVIESIRVVRVLSKRLAAIIRERQPVLVIAELPLGSSRNSRAATCMALACATVVSTCAFAGVELHNIRPLEVKEWAGGKKRKEVPKEQVIAKVVKHFGGKLLPQNSKAEHVADAMACLAVWKEKYEQR